MLQPQFCRIRQQRLLPEMAAAKLDAIVVANPQHVYYLTGHRTFWQQHSAVLLRSDGRSILFCANDPNDIAATDDIVAYTATFRGTQRQEQPTLVADAVRTRLRTAQLRRVGIDASPVTAMLAMTLPEIQLSDIEPMLWQLRRRKDPDELASMRRAIACTETMHRVAREMICPGVAELDIFSALHAAAVSVAGEPLSAHLGNDFACGVPGGPPRKDRPAVAGELYILDLGPAVRGYFADNSRAISVDRKPTDAQLKAWTAVTGIFPIVEKMARPGARCRDIFAAADTHYRATLGVPFPHHLGHGVGLQPHEFPHLNPDWDDVLMEGEIFTAEPGIYGPELGGGMRIENQYLVTRDGVENLTPFPLELS